MMPGALIAMALAMAQPTGWTWTLYEGSGPIVLANERPDTTDLRSTLECGAGSGTVKVSLYGSQLGTGVATVSSGDASAAVETSAGTDGAIVVTLRTDHPVFARLTASGALAVVAGAARQTIEIPASDLAKLRRFADLCSD